jgi:hypothetical protein
MPETKVAIPLVDTLHLHDFFWECYIEVGSYVDLKPKWSYNQRHTLHTKGLQ